MPIAANKTDATVMSGDHAAHHNELANAVNALNDNLGTVSSVGDAQNMYVATTASRLALRKGTTASPDTNLGPVLKVERTVSLADTAITGDGGEQLASILGVCVGTTTTEVQPVGVYGAAKNSSANAGAVSASPDACGLYGAGRITGSGTGTAIGGFLIGRRDTNTARVNTLELHCANYTPTVDSYTSAGFQQTQALWLNAGGDADSAAGIVFGNAFGRRFDVGIGFTAQATTGGVKTASIRDDSQSATSLLINGTHATASLAIAAGAGKALLGGTASAFGITGTVLEVLGVAGTSVDGLMCFGATSGTDSYSIRMRNGVGQSVIAVAGAGWFLTGSAAGDLVIAPQTTGKGLHLGGTTKVVTVMRDNTLGFHAATPIAKPTVTGARGGNAALASLLTSLANYGLITDSSTA